NDVLAQLCGPSATYTAGKPYPTILGSNATGFASSYSALNPGSTTNLNYHLDPQTSPSTTAMPDGSFRTAIARTQSGQTGRWLSVVGPGYTFNPDWGFCPGSSP